MGENEIPKYYDMDAKWDACLDLSLRRFVYSSFAGAFSGLLFFRSPATRWASVAFGAGVGLGSAYSDCSQLFDKPTSNLKTATVSDTPVSQVSIWEEAVGDFERHFSGQECSGTLTVCLDTNIERKWRGGQMRMDKSDFVSELICI